MMWSSFTLRRVKEVAKHDTAADGDKAPDIVNKRLTRAATFCFDSDYKEKRKKTNWLRNLPNIKKGINKIKSEKYKFEDYKIKQEDDENACTPVKPRYVNISQVITLLIFVASFSSQNESWLDMIWFLEAIASLQVTSSLTPSLIQILCHIVLYGPVWLHMVLYGPM